MILRDARRLLGVARNADARTIRRAYADALRAIDPDVDPQGFADLRDARDAALAAARARTEATSAAIEVDLSDDADAVPFDPAIDRKDDVTNVDLPLASEVEGEEQQREAELAEHARALAALLAPDGPAGAYLDAGEVAVAHGHLDALLADPRLDLLDVRIWAEQWYAELICTAGTRADPVLPRLVDFFDWRRGRGRVDQSPAVAAVADRYADMVFVGRLSDPGHPEHRPWAALTGQQTGLWNLLLRAGRVRGLLALVRREHPDVERYFDPAEVARWENGGASGFWRLALIGLWFLFVVGRYGAGLSADEPVPIPVAQPLVAASATPPSALTSPLADMQPVLQAMGGNRLTLAALAAANPAYHRALLAHWDQAHRANQPPQAFRAALYDDVYRQYDAALRRADYDLVAKVRRFQLDRLTYIREQAGAVACGNTVLRKPDPTHYIDFQPEQRRRLFGEVLLAMKGVPKPSESDKFDIPGVVWSKAMERAGMARPVFRRAIDGNAGATQACTAWIALRREALALPPARGLKLLREM